MLLASLVLPLEAEVRPDPRFVQGWLYGLIAQANPELHDDNNIKPFTLGSIGGRNPAIRITFLDEGLHAALSPTLWSLVGKSIRLGETRVKVKALLEEGHPWAGLTTYQRIFQGEPASDYPLKFASPTFFKRKGTHYPLPEPRLVFGSLLQRFTAFAPVTPSNDLPKIFEQITLRSAQIHTVSTKHEVRAVGSLGRVVYHLPMADEDDLRWLTALWRFSFYAGIGAKTSFGFGQAKPLKLARPKELTHGDNA